MMSKVTDMAALFLNQNFTLFQVTFHLKGDKIEMKIMILEDMKWLVHL